MQDSVHAKERFNMLSVTEDEEDVVGCLPRLLLATHQQEVESIVNDIPDAVLDGNLRKLENNLDRYSRLLNIYQEQPSLLDSIVPNLLNKLLTYITLPGSGSSETHLNELSIVSMSYLSHLTKVRGYKVVVRLLPHQVSYLDKLLNSLEKYSGPVRSDLSERYILLLWLWIVCKNPFDLRRFDPSDKPGSTMSRILSISLSYLDYPWNNTHYAAALVISQCLARSDGIPLLAGVLTNCVKNIALNSEKILGNLILILAILKHVDRQHLVCHMQLLRDAVQMHFPLKTSDALIRKSLIKMVQRMALVVLRPKVADWRYRRGKRRLEENLMKKCTGESKTVMNGNGHSNGDVHINDEGYSIHELVEWSLDCILRALSDDETTVRWSAAKGAGRITARLPRYLANQVVNSILADNFHRLAGHCSWHGGCLALAELSRRGFLLPENLPQAFPIIQEALFYEEPMGRHALGSNVRDAACYVLWAFARAYEPSELKEYINTVATSLMCTAVFDREVNLRRAASAAFQENVGRQSNFPDGIALLTIADYFAVGNRLNCYTKVCVDVVKYAKYADAMVNHLIEKKIAHWDEVIRIQASLALGHIAAIHKEYVSSKLEMLLDGCRSSNPVYRHGHLLALSQCLRGLLSSGYNCDECIICSAVGLPEELQAESQRLKVAGGELTRKALSSFMGTLAKIPISLKDEEVGTWLSRINSFACDDTESVRKSAVSAAAIFLPAYLSSQSRIETFHYIMDYYTKGISTPIKENERIGVCGLVSCFPAKIMNEKIFRALCNVVLRKCEYDMKWAMGRRAAVQALGSVFIVGLINEWVEPCFEALFKGLEDYTTNSKGDIGRLVREAAMSSLTDILTHPSLNEELIQTFAPLAICKMIQQSAEKIGRTRECACNCIIRLLSSFSIRTYIIHAEELMSIYHDGHTFILDSILLSMTPLLLCDEYYSHLLRGLVISAGGISEGTTKMALQTIMEYQSSVAKDIKLVERFLTTIADLFDEGMRVPRIGSSVLRLLPHVLAHLPILEEYPDCSQALTRIISLLKRVVCSSKASPVRVRCALLALCSLLSFNPKSTTWRTAVELVSGSLLNPLPVIRRGAAEGLYENLCMSDVDNEVLLLLSGTAWQDDITCVSNAASSIQRILIGNPVI